VIDEGAAFGVGGSCWLRGGMVESAAAKALRIVHHDKNRRHRDRTFASSPAPRQPDGRGHRRGLDGPSMPKTKQKTDGIPPSECCLL
jgi:hypothetical protein